jgi:hypothetical protein
MPVDAERPARAGGTAELALVLPHAPAVIRLFKRGEMQFREKLFL